MYGEGGLACFMKFNKNGTESDFFQDIVPHICFLAQYSHQNHIKITEFWVKGGGNTNMKII